MHEFLLESLSMRTEIHIYIYITYMHTHDIYGKAEEQSVLIYHFLALKSVCFSESENCKKMLILWGYGP